MLGEDQKGLVTLQKSTFSEIKLKKSPASQETTESERNALSSFQYGSVTGKGIKYIFEVGKKNVGWKSIVKSIVSLRNDTSFYLIASGILLHLKCFIPGFDKL